jgi:SNF2 family DNA or RNA helicase
VNPKWTVSKRRDKADQAMALAQMMERPFVLVVNYEAAWREPFASWLGLLRWDVSIYDESHRIKAPGGKASRYTSKLKRVTGRRLALTGTPMPHSPLDLYAQYRALDTNVFGTSFARFRARYAIMGGYENRQVIGWRNMDELMAIFRAHSFTVTKSDVLDLPPVVHQAVPIELSPAVMKQYKEFERELVLEFDRGLVTVDNALVKFLRLQQITSGYIKLDPESDAPRLEELGTEKADVLYDLLSDLPADEPVVVFARFHVDLDNIHRVSKELKRTSYELSGRMNSYHVWNSDESGAVLAVQIQSGSMGIDLTKSAYAIYYSVGFSLGDFDQSVARLDRPGQTRSVTMYHLIAQETVDVKVYRALREKRDVVNAVRSGFGGWS